MEFDICSDMICHNNGTCASNSSHIECICPSGFSGIFCENVIESVTDMATSNKTSNETLTTTDSTLEKKSNSRSLTDTNTIPTTTQDKVASSAESPFYPTLTVRGRIDKHNKDSVGKGLRDLLYELIKIRNQLYLDIKYKVKKTSEG